MTESIGIVLNTIEANTRTEDLLKQSQSLAKELQSQQQELQQTNQRTGRKGPVAGQAEHRGRNARTSEVEQARQALEEKATQLALTSKYKSEFLANMSHELRTPLNSLLILSDQLAKNNERQPDARQVEFAKTIHASGNDLLALINDILDLSKIESGTVIVDVGEIAFRGSARATSSGPSATWPSARSWTSTSISSADLPHGLHTDVKRLQQIIKNLLSNAFKFTERGQGHVPASTGHAPAGSTTTKA